MDRRTLSLIVLAGAALALLWLAPQVFFIVFAGILMGVSLRSGHAIFLALIVVSFGGCAYKFAPDVATQVEEFTQQVPRAATPLIALIITLVDHLYVRQLEHETRPIGEKTAPELWGLLRFRSVGAENGGFREPERSVRLYMSTGSVESRHLQAAMA